MVLIGIEPMISALTFDSKFALEGEVILARRINHLCYRTLFSKLEISLFSQVL